MGGGVSTFRGGGGSLLQPATMMKVARRVLLRILDLDELPLERAQELGVRLEALGHGAHDELVARVGVLLELQAPLVDDEVTLAGRFLDLGRDSTADGVARRVVELDLRLLLDP